MKQLIASLALLLLIAAEVQAIKIKLFIDTDTFVRRAKDIVIAKCLAPVVNDPQHYEDGLYPIDVQIISALKGEKKPGKTKIATIYPMETGKTYLLASLGGSAYGTDFLAVPQLSVVEVPANFRLEELKDKNVTEQLQMVFAARRRENERQRRLLDEEKKLLDKAASK